MENQTGNTRPPNYVGMLSPDGRWQWNGMQWVPAAQRRDNRMPGQSLPTPVLMALVGLAVAVIFGLVAVIFAEHEDSEDGRQVHEIYCERWAEPGDPECR